MPSFIRFAQVVLTLNNVLMIATMMAASSNRHQLVAFLLLVVNVIGIDVVDGQNVWTSPND